MAEREVPDWAADGRVVRQVRQDPGNPVDTTRWPATVPAVEQLLCEGLALAPGLTVLVGENGSGKSTLVEMLAELYLVSAWRRFMADPDSYFRRMQVG